MRYRPTLLKQLTQYFLLRPVHYPYSASEFPGMNNLSGVRLHFWYFSMPLLAASLSRFRPKSRALPSPASPHQRIAQISATSRLFNSAQPFSRDRWHKLQSFRPEVLVGSASDLQRLYRLNQPGSFALSSIDHAVFVLTQCGRGPLSDVLRVSLWQAFGVPLYELFIDSHGRLLASECEAHEGWHVEPGIGFSLVQRKLLVDGPFRKGVSTGLTAEFDDSPCPCGREGMRLINIDAHVAWVVRQELATAASA